MKCEYFLTLVVCVLSFHWGSSEALLNEPHTIDYCIVGAGPAGLELGHFLKKANRGYVIFERSPTVGSFFDKYPIHDKLISINKRYTGKTNKEFNLRHDWNTILSDNEDLKFGSYSKEYFPHRRDLLRYLKDYHRILDINVLFNTNITNIATVSSPNEDSQSSHGFSPYRYILSDGNNNQYNCKYLVIATGIWVPNIPPMIGIEHAIGYENISTNAEDFEGKTIIILGRGNSAFEVAQQLYGRANFIHMIGRSRVRHSWATHYVGDLRAVNNELLDAYQLKSLDAVVEAPVTDGSFEKRPDGRFNLIALHSLNEEEPEDNFAMREPYDVIIRCLGFNFDMSIFDGSMNVGHAKKSKKYPLIKHNYESVKYPGLFFAGTITHSLDFRKSAGGFIHGFRYTVRALHKLLEWRNHGVPWPYTSYDLIDLLSTMIRRINEASGIYQMFQVLCDVYLFKNDMKEVWLLEEFPVNLLPEFEKMTGHNFSQIIVSCLEYGANFSGPGKDVFSHDRARSEESSAHLSNFLHPVYYFYDKLPSAQDFDEKPRWLTLPEPKLLHHIVEDFLTSFDGRRSHITPLRKFLENCTQSDLRQFTAQSCFKLTFTSSKYPVACERYLNSGFSYFST